MRSLFDQSSCPLRSAHTASHAALGPRRDQTHNRRVFTCAQGCVEIDHLQFWKSRELMQHFERRAGFQSAIAALHELNHFPIHQVDARDDHKRTGVPRAAKNFFKSPIVQVP